MHDRFSGRRYSIAAHRQRGGDGDDGSQNLLFWMLVGSIVASQVSRQFSPKPFYHAVGARFRQRIQEETRSDRPVAAEPNPSTKEQA